MVATVRSPAAGTEGAELCPAFPVCPGGKGAILRFSRNSGWWPLCILLLFVACAKGPMPIDSAHRTEDSPPRSEAYRIGKGDILEIVTWKEPDFSRDVQVRIDGKIGFPLLDDLEAAGRTTGELEADIRESLVEYVTYPVVSISVKDPASQKYYVMGEIARPGEYPLRKDVSILQAVALAGGFSEWADKKRVVLIRRDEDGEKSFRINYKEIVSGKKLEQNVLLRADDIILVP
jgi:polysaccharide biosynthesis/export protein